MAGGGGQGPYGRLFHYHSKTGGEVGGTPACRAKERTTFASSREIGPSRPPLRQKLPQ